MREITLPTFGIFLIFKTAIVLAGGSAPQSDHAAKPVVQAHEQETLETHNLEQNLSPEERQGLYRDLLQQSESGYADHATIESRREGMRKKLLERVQQADTDNDNSVSRLEAEENLPALVKYFDEIDLNHDGVITMDELKAAEEIRRQAREQLAISDNAASSANPQRTKSNKKHSSSKKPQKSTSKKEPPSSSLTVTDKQA